VLAAALGAALALTACQGGDGGPPREPVTQTRFLEELSAAIDGVNDARRRLATDGNALSAAATALDAVDAVAVTGNRDAVRNRRPKAAAAAAKAATAARALTKHVRAYGTAVETLAQAPTAGLDDTQRAAVLGVVRAARDEHRQLRGYATVIASSWPRYERLNEAQVLWLQRASNGWYRDTKEAAGAYVVMTDREALARDRRSFAGADERRLAAARVAGDAITAARGALASLAG
jgi:hypothetical protein